MDDRTNNTKFSAILQYCYQRLANSNTTKEALKCTASIAADSIVDTISFITGVLFCDPKTSYSHPAADGFEKVKSGATLDI